MKRIILMLFVFGLLPLALAAAESSTEPTTTLVIASGVGVDPDKALRDALKNAVQQAVGAIVDAETLVKNDEVIKDQILTYSDGYVEHFDKIGESKRADGLFELRIKATIKRRQLIGKLQTSKVLSTKLDGQSLFAEVVTQLDASKDAAKLLEKALEGLPLNLLVAKVADQKPRIEAMTDTGVTATWTVLVSYDYNAYKTKVLPALHKTLVDIAKKRSTGTLFLKYYQSSSPNDYYMISTQSKSVFWRWAAGRTTYSQHPDVEKLSCDADTECMLLVHWSRAPQDGSEQLGWYVLDKSCQPVLEALQAHHPRLHISLVDQQGNVIQEDEINMKELYDCKFDFLRPTNSKEYESQKLSGYNFKEFPWFVTTEKCYGQKKEETILIEPMMQATYSGGPHLGNPLDFKWTRKLSLEEIKNIREIRCTFTEKSP
jgi:hypothetical protein